MLIYAPGTIKSVSVMIYNVVQDVGTHRKEGSGPGPAHLVKASSPAAGESPVRQKRGVIMDITTKGLT